MLVILLWFLILSSAVAAPSDNCEAHEGRGVIWIKRIVAEGLLDYTPFGLAKNGVCTKHSNLYKQHLANLTYWAAKMYDASSIGAVPGILEGQNTDFGHFEECISAESKVHGITGQYMLAELDFAPSRKLDPDFFKRAKVWREPNPDDLAWTAIRPTDDPRVVRMNKLEFAVCVPASCSEADIEYSLKQTLLPLLESQDISANITILSLHTYSRARFPRSPPASFFFFLCTVGIIIMLVLLSTFHDILHNLHDDLKRRIKEGENCSIYLNGKLELLAEEIKSMVKNLSMLRQDVDVDYQKDHEKNSCFLCDSSWFRSFSIKKNVTDIFLTKDNEFACISGMKVLSMFFIIFGHRMFITIGYNLFNPKGTHLAAGNILATFVENGPIVVNTFMTITGFLIFYKITKTVTANEELNVFKSIVHRWLRLTPAYFAAMTVQYYLFMFVEGGPLGRNAAYDVTKFGKYWWTNILYINNYVHPGEHVLIPSWYMAFDMQMFIFTYLLAGILRHVWKLTPYVLSFLAIIASVIPVITILNKGYYGAFLIPRVTYQDMMNQEEFQITYIPTHTRAAPYIIGMLGGYMYHYAKIGVLKFNVISLYGFKLLCLLLFLACFLLPCFFFRPDREYVLWENIAYPIYSRIAQGVVILLIIYLTNFGNSGLFRVFLCHPAYEVLNKLNYCALVIHPIVQIYLVGLVRAPVYYDRLIGVWMGFGDIVATYLLSVLLYCLVEGPFSHIQQLIPCLKSPKKNK